MATSYNAKAVVDGLVLMLDPANPRSYSGTGTSWYDIGPNNYHATLVNGPTYVGAGGSSYFSCDGSNDNISMPLNIGTDCTVDMWINPGVLTGTIIWSNNSDSYVSGPTLYMNGGYLVWNTGDSNANPFSNSYYLTNDIWSNVTITNASASNAKLYINGQLIGTASYRSFATTGTGTKFKLGEYDPSGLNSRAQFGQFKIYNRALSSTEILQNYNSGKGRYYIPAPVTFDSSSYFVVTDGLVSYLNAGISSSYSGTGSTWYDLSGNNNHFAIYNTQYRSDIKGGVLQFPGNAWGKSISNTLLNTSAYTKYIIVVPSSNSNWLSSSEGSHVFWGNGGEYMYGGHNGGWTNIGYTGEKSSGRWSANAFAFSTASGTKLYKNGALVASQPGQTTTFSGTGNVKIFAFGDGANLSDGYVGAVLIYNRSLTDAEALQNFNALRGRFNI
jgi:hypothetical protein